ncbi:uncharacterized protein LACBIDRAFT_329040 [Laccaria bicolor S238N-H82]|uniref:Predicted protein n=1 Tax=Laccaria bicolor (strain S238N-H82 / ATCC MYA-4686) TaxID=486041 RepID=B0DGU9_LACBS|nr:uncharacterized protein LACBIDRAFT_329040 [Laccaria bicolor S238N-H82]EDR06335.1 predicted protein [Laccaria bicolor S238N-H82]|eukprot:XP_001883196.1 predicted protein [Laccaria bicolor S238N-H82]
MTKHKTRSLRRSEAPLLLSRVCSTWRNAAINTPHLWKQLEFRIPDPLGLSISVDLVEKMKVWVGRARDLPVLLRLVLRKRYIPAAEAYFSLEETLSQEPLSSVCNLDISIPTSANLYPSFERADGFKRLESLVVRSQNNIDPTADQSHLMLLPGATMLRRAVLLNVISQRISSTLFPWSQLTHLYAGHQVSVELWYRVMSYCVNLRVASFGIVGWWSDYNFRPTGKSILLPHLSILNIMHDQCRTLTSDESEFPFSGLALPALSTLRFVANDLFTQAWSGLSDYSQLHFLREFALIRSFDLPSTHLQDLCRLFEATPFLSSLQLSIQTPYDVLFANLLPTAKPSLLPNLENLEIHCTGIWRYGQPEDFPPLFVDLIKARWWIPAYDSRKTVRLQQAVLDFKGMGEAETYLAIIRKSLQPCVDEGLNLHLGDDLDVGEDPIHVMPFSNDTHHWHEDLIDGGAIHFGGCETCFELPEASPQESQDHQDLIGTRMIDDTALMLQVDLPADIHEYARSSYGLSDVDLNRIASYIEECTKNLACIEKQLAIELEIERPWPNHIRADLRLRKTTEIRRIRICRQIGAPIRRLPLEILGEIFTFCLPPVMTKHRARSLCKREAPLLLCRVCSSWRNAAINTPHLWKELEFRIPDPYGLSIPVDLVEKMKVWVGRARDLPVLLRLVLLTCRYIPAAGASVSLEETLSQEPLSSMCNLDISIPISSDLFPSFKQADGFERLESLAVRTYSTLDTTVDQSHLILLPGASMLRRVVLIDVISQRISSTLFPWSQLTHLYAGHQLSIDLWYRVISYCVNLRVASFGIAGWWSYYDILLTTEPVLLPYLSILNIMHDQFPDDSEFPFSGLALPALRTLRILSSDACTWSGLSDYSQLHFLREFALIGSFNISPTHIEDLCRLFEATPVLSSLQLSIQTPYDVLFAKLLPTASPSLLPNLENLEIHCKIWNYMQPDEFPPLFIDLIKARWWILLQSQAPYNFRKTVRLQQAILDFNGMGEAETYLDIIRKSLQPCVDEGLDLHVGDCPEGADPIHVMPFTNDIQHWHEDLIDGGAIRSGSCHACFD